MASVVSTCCCMLATICSRYFIDVVGRRILLLISCSVMALSSFAIGIVLVKVTRVRPDLFARRVDGLVSCCPSRRDSVSWRAPAMGPARARIRADPIPSFPTLWRALVLSFVRSLAARNDDDQASVVPQLLTSAVVIFGVCLYYVGYAIGIGPVLWVLISEIFENRLRAKVGEILITRVGRFEGFRRATERRGVSLGRVDERGDL